MERPNFWPGIRLHDDASEMRRSFAGLPRLDFTRGYSVSDYQLMSRIRSSIQRGGSLEEVGRGGDMVAYSRPDLDFVIKFPYDNATLEPTGFNYRVSYGFSLAKENLSGILAPCIDVYGIFTDIAGKEHGVLTIIQRKVAVAEAVIREYLAQERIEEVDQIKQDFVGINQQMWERGVFDSDTAWPENYGLLPRGQLVLIDIGYLLDDPNLFSLYEGIPRPPQYEADIRNNFKEEGFRKFFGKKPYLKKRSPNSLISLASKQSAAAAFRRIRERDDEHMLQTFQQIQREDQDWN